MLAAVPASAAELRVVAYVIGWQTPPQIDPTKLTHINFAFGKIEGGKVVLPHPGVAANLAYLRSLKAKNPRLKVLLSVGGWEAEGFSDAALSAASRARLCRKRRRAPAHALARRCRPRLGVPGPKRRGHQVAPAGQAELHGAAEDRARAARRARAAADRYLLTIASADREYFDFTEMDKLHVYLDFINVMTYDFFNSLTPTTGHHAGLYASAYAAPTDRNADASIKQHLAAGIPADKLVLGVAFYGRGFAGVKPEHRGLNQPYERFEAAHSYAELVDKFIGRNGFVREWDARAQAPFLWNAQTRAFITYDDPQSIAVKADYVRKHAARRHDVLGAEPGLARRAARCDRERAEVAEPDNSRQAPVAKFGKFRILPWRSWRLGERLFST